MKPKSFQRETSSRDRWMISYMDVLTILLIFFVAVAAKSLEPSRIDAPTVEAVKSIPPDPEPVLARTPIQENLETYGLDWRPGPSGLVISLPEAVLFKPGKAEINPAAQPEVGRIAAVLRGIQNQISLAGHADRVPIHNRRFKNNWELAAARSLALFNLLTTRYEVAESRFSISSYGSTDPRNPNDTAEGRANNRRVEIIILDETPALPPAGK